MYSRRTILKNKSGLHARPAANFVALASNFAAKITIRRVDAEQFPPANAKSILKVLTLGLTESTPIEISAEGVDEKAAVDQLIELVEIKLVG